MKKMKYWIIFLMLTLVWLSLTQCTKNGDKYRLKGFFTVNLHNEK
jgi:hypothetical protein